MKKLLLLCIAGILLSCSQSPEQKARRLYDKALKQMDEFALAQADSTLTQINDTDPTSKLGYYGRGNLYERQMRPYEALNVFISLSSGPTPFLPAYPDAIRILEQLEEHDLTVRFASEYLDWDHTDPQAHLLFANALMDIGQHRRARLLLDSSLSIGGDPVVVGLESARSYFGEHLFDSALVVYNNSIGKYEELASQSRAAARYWELAGNIDSSLFYSRMATSGKGTTFPLLVEHFQRALTHQYLFEARRVLQELSAQGAREETTVGFELEYYLAANERTKVKKSNDAFSRAHRFCLDVLFRDTEIWTHDGDIMTALKNTGAIDQLLSKGNYDQTFSDFVNYQIRMLIASTLHDREVGLLLSEIPKQYRNRPEVQIAETYLYQRTGENDKFKNGATLIEKYHGAHAEWLSRLADLYQDWYLKQYADAKRLYRQALKLDAWYSPALIGLVEVFRKQGQLDSTVAILSEFPHMLEHVPSVKLLQVTCEAESGNLEPAIAHFRSYFPTVRGNMQQFHEMDSLVDKFGSLDQREDLYEFLEQVDADNPDALIRLAKFNGDNGHFEKVIEIVDRIKGLEPSLLEAEAQRARAMYYLGQQSDAKKLLEENILTDEFNVSSNLYLSRILAEEQADLNRAGNLARRAVFDSRHDLEVWMNLCYVYSLAGRHDLAMGEARKSITTYKTSPEPYYRLGMAQIKQERDGAKANLEKSIELGLRGKLLESARQALANM